MKILLIIASPNFFDTQMSLLVTSWLTALSAVVFAARQVLKKWNIKQ